VTQWGLRFKIPTGLVDLEYRINDESVAFYAKPASTNVEYRPSYDAVDQSGSATYASGVLYRSDQSSKDVIGNQVAGKKIGDYYYYTAWSFSGLATGRGYIGLFYDDACLADPALSKCQSYLEAEGEVFALMDELLTSIEPASPASSN
jgi:hypothetical protein